MQINVQSFHRGISAEHLRIYEKNNTIFAEKRGLLSWIAAFFSRLGLNSRHYHLKTISEKLEGQLVDSHVYAVFKNRITAYNKTHQPAIEFSKLLKKVEKVAVTPLSSPKLALDIPPTPQKAPSPIASPIPQRSPLILRESPRNHVSPITLSPVHAWTPVSPRSPTGPLSPAASTAPPSPALSTPPSTPAPLTQPLSPPPSLVRTQAVEIKGLDSPIKIEPVKKPLDMVIKVDSKEGRGAFQFLSVDAKDPLDFSFLVDGSPIFTLKEIALDAAKERAAKGKSDESKVVIVDYEADFSMISRSSFERFGELIPLLYRNYCLRFIQQGDREFPEAQELRNRADNLIAKTSPEELLEINHLAEHMGVKHEVLERLEKLTFNKIYLLPEKKRQEFALSHTFSSRMENVFNAIETYWFTHDAKERFPWSDKEEDVDHFHFFKKNSRTPWGKIGLACCYFYGIGTPKIKINDDGFNRYSLATDLLEDAKDTYRDWKRKNNLFVRYGAMILESSGNPFGKHYSADDVAELAERGHLRAKFFRAMITGNPSETFKELADLGFSCAERVLGHQFLKSFKKSKPSLSRELYLLELKRAYNEGNITLHTAIEYYRRAAQHGDLEACKKLLKYDFFTLEEKKRYHQLWLQNGFADAYQHGEIRSLFSLALGHLGFGPVKITPEFQDKKEGIRLIQILAKSNFPPAMYCLGTLYKAGFIPNKEAHLEEEYRKKGNLKKADALQQAWKEKASRLGDEWLQKAISTKAPSGYFSNDFAEMLANWKEHFSAYQPIGEVEMPRTSTY